MTAFGGKVFSGMMPRVSARLLEDRFCQKAVNVTLTSGELRPLQGNLQIGSNLLTKTGVKKTIYRYGNDVNSESYYWFNFLDDKSIVRGNVSGDSEERIYFSGAENIVVLMWTNDATLMWTNDATPMWSEDGFLKASMTYKSIALSGSDYPSNFYTLGIPAPETSPALSVANRTITSLTRSGAVVTATTDLPHELANGESAVVFGALQSDYNGTHVVTVLNANTFTYTIAGTPASPATGALSFNFGGLAQTIVYALTYVSELGEEGSPKVTALVNVTPGQEVTLSSLPVAPVGNYNIAKKRIYRTESGSSETSLRFVAEQPIGATSFVDRVKGTALGENCPSITWAVPPNELSGLIDVQNGIMAGIADNQVCFCFPYQPHAWPISYRYSFAVKPIAIGSFGQSVVVLNNGTPSVLTGIDPSQMTQDNIKHGHPCMSVNSVVELVGGVAWASDEGIAFIDNSGFRLLTSAHFTKKEWKNYYPNTIRACRYRNSYIGFYEGQTKAGFVFDIETQEFYELSFYADAAYTDPKNGNLYFAIGNNIFKFDSDTSVLDMTWKSKVFSMPKPINMGYGKVVAKEYPVQLKIYGDKVLRYSVNVQNGLPFPLPCGYKATDFEVEISGQSTVYGYAIAESVRELQGIVE